MGHAPTVDQQLPELGLRKGARVLRSTLREWRAGTTASSAKGGRPTRTPNLAYRSSSLSLLRGGRPEDTAVVPGGSTTTPLAGVTSV